MLLYKTAAIAGAVLFIAFLVARFAPSKRSRVRRAVAVLALFLLAVGGSVILTRVGETQWAHNLTVVADVLAAFNVISAVGLVVFELLLPRLGIHLAGLVSDVILGALYITAFFFGLRDAGVELTGIITTSAVVTGILALSLQATLGNVIGGVALQLDGSIGIGDWVQLENGKKGRVNRIGWRHTVLETNDWDTLIVPNSTLLGSVFTLLGKRGGKRLHHRMWVYFNIDFRYSPTDVITVVDKALCGAPIEGVVPEPKPNCVCMNFGDTGHESVGRYAARYWLTDMAHDDPTSSRVRARIFAALKRAEIPLAVPASHIWMEKDTEARRQRQRQTRLERRTQALRALTFLSVLDDAEVERLAARLHYVPFNAGEIITQQGAVAHFLYIVTVGEVEVRVGAEGQDRLVNVVKGPGFVGEWGLMTGQPRKATVIARTDVECYRLDKDAFASVLHDRPELARTISELLVERMRELQDAITELHEEAAHELVQAETGRLMHTIREFFGLDGN